MWPGGAEAKHKGRDTPKDTPPDPNTETLTSSLDDLVASLREQMAADPNTEALTAALAAKDETIELLKQQLEAQTRANDENHRIIGALTERLALPSPETREDAAYDVETADRAETIRRTPERSTWANLVARGYGGGGSGGGRVAVGVGSLFGKQCARADYP